MTISNSQYVFSPWLTPVQVVSTSNIAGTYYNGPNNDGVGATLTIAASSLTIDSVVVTQGQRVLLKTQTPAYEQGIYVVSSIGSTVVLTRAEDQQSLEQIQTGQYVSVAAGTVNAGTFFTIIEPRPQAIGVSAIIFNDVQISGSVTFSGGPSSVNAPAVFSNISGDIAPQTSTALFGFGITVATGNILASTGNVQAGTDGNAGALISFSPTAANGSLIVAAGNAGAAFNTTISSSVMGQSTVYTIPDIGASTGDFVVSPTAIRMHSVASAANAGGSPSATFTDAFCTSRSNVIGNWNTQANPASVLQIVPGAGSFVVTSSADAGIATFNYIIMN